MGAFLCVKVPSAGGSTKRIAGGKGVHCEMESEGSPRQTADPMGKNHIRHTRMGKVAIQTEALSFTESGVYMWRIHGGKERDLLGEISQTTINRSCGIKLAVRSQQRA